MGTEARLVVPPAGGRDLRSLKPAGRMGADHLVDATAGDPVAAVRELAPRPGGFPRFVEWYRTGSLDLAALVTYHYRLDQVADAVEDLRAGRVRGRAVIDLQPTRTDDR